MDRRTFNRGLLSAGLVGVPGLSIGQIALGSGTLTTISDGSFALPLALPEEVPADELTALVDRFGLVAGDTSPRPLNVTLWRSGDRLVLFDAGSGPTFVDTAGALYENLDAAGVATDEITDVVFTHAHPDHIWGILDDFDEVPFSSANLWIGQDEFDYWTAPGTFDALDETVQFFAVGAQRRLDAIADRLSFFADGAEILPGVVARATYGHTPGHMSFSLRDGGDEVLVLGDCVTNDHLHFARPGWPSANDQDPDRAAESRQAMLSELARSGALVVGYHLPDGGVGRVETEGEGYRFIGVDV